MFESIIDAGTVQAFRETEYKVHGEEPFTLRVGGNLLGVGRRAQTQPRRMQRVHHRLQPLQPDP